MANGASTSINKINPQATLRFSVVDIRGITAETLWGALGKQNWESKIVRKYFYGLSWTRENGIQIQAIAVCLGGVYAYEIAIRANLS